MATRQATCIGCGIRAGAGSSFKRGLCMECQTARQSRKGTRSALYHMAILIGGVHFALNGVDGLVGIAFLSLAFIDVIAIVTTVVHETAHALTAMLLGFSVREVSLGVGPRLASFSLGGLRVTIRLYAAGGHTAFNPVGGHVRGKMLLTTIAGPLSHLPLAAWLATLSSEDPIWEILLGYGPQFVILLLVLNLIPALGSDGQNMFRLVMMPNATIETMTSMAASLDGLAPTIHDPVANPAHHGQREAILAHLDNRLELTQRALALNNLAAVDLLLEDEELLSEADEASGAAFQLLPDNSAIRNTRGAALIMSGRFAEGIEMVNPTLSRIPAESVGETHLDLAYAHVHLDHVFEGRRHLHAATGRTARQRTYERALARLGSLEVPVVRRFVAEAGTPEQAAVRFRSEAGPEAETTAMALRSNIDSSGDDADLLVFVETLAPGVS